MTELIDGDLNPQLEPVRLFDAILGLFAYEQGDAEEGINSASLTAEVERTLNGMQSEQRKQSLASLIQSHFLSIPEVSIDDLKSFLSWLDQIGVELCC